MTEPKYDEDLVSLGYLNKTIEETEETISEKYKNVTKHYGTQPQPPYYEGDTWIDGNKIYVCINTRKIGMYQSSDWITESGATELAKKKNQIFLRQPDNYNAGDMWILQNDNDHKAGVKGEILISIAGRKEYEPNDWINMLGYGTIRSINEVAGNLNGAIDRIGVVEDAIADGVIITFYQSTIPEGVHIGDLWYVTGKVENYIEGKLYRYDGENWCLLDDPDIQKAFDEANEARLVADGKIQSFYSKEAPTKDLGVGDLWIDLANDNKLYRYNGTNWVAVYDTRIDELEETTTETTERVTSIESDLGKIDLKVSENTKTITTVSSKLKEKVKGVDVMYALGTSETVAPISGWSTISPKWENGKYMWQKTLTIYEDDKIIQSDPICISGARGEKGEKGEQGIPGNIGTDGKTSYFHIKYSDMSNPTSASQISEIPSKYIGTYVDYIQEDSEDPSKYTWSQFFGNDGKQGEQGIPGKNGINGDTSYLHIKYSNDNGKTFTGNSGEDVGDYIGQCVDFTIDDPTSVSSYKWSKIKGNKGETGDTGIGVKNIVDQYYLSTSSTTQTGGSWKDTQDEWKDGYYIWTRSQITWTDNSISYTVPVLANGINGVLKNISTIKTNLADLSVENDKISAKVSETTTKVEDLESSIEYFSTDLDLYNLVIPVDTLKKPTESSNYYIGYYSYFKGKQITPKVEILSTISGFSMSIENSRIKISTNKDTSISNEINEVEINFSYSNYSIKKKITLVLAPKGEKGETGASGKNGNDGVSYWRSSATIDLSSDTYDVNKWYPVTGTPLPASSYNRILLYVALNSGVKPIWSTHTRGFSVNLDVSAIGSGWGTTSGESIIYADTFSFCSVSPASFKQMGYSSTPVLYLRGGGKYYVKTDYVCTWTPRPTGYAWTSGNYSQTVEPLDSRPVPDGTNIKGKSSYFYVRYSENSTGNPMTTAPTANTKYMGVASTSSSTAPTSYAAYTWSNIKGADGKNGSAGQAGVDGRTSYLHIKYSEDGTTFTPAEDEYELGEKPSAYVGQYVDFNKADSTNFEDYQWYKFTEDIDHELNNMKNSIDETKTKLENDYLTTEQIESKTENLKEDINVIKKQQASMELTSTGLQIQIDTINNEGIKNLKNTLVEIDEEGIKVSKGSEFNSLLDDTGVYLKSYEKEIASYTKDGARMYNLTVQNEAQIGNLKILSVEVNGKKRTHIHWIGG